jgi:hypothetical protein
MISKPEGDGCHKATSPFCSFDLKMNMEECEMKKKVMFVLAALAAAGAAVTGYICLGNVKLYGR